MTVREKGKHRLESPLRSRILLDWKGALLTCWTETLVLGSWDKVF